MTEKSKWTKEDQARLAALIASGLPGREIAAELGRTHVAVHLQAKKLGLNIGRGQRGLTDVTKGPSSTSYSRLFGD